MMRVFLSVMGAFVAAVVSIVVCLLSGVQSAECTENTTVCDFKPLHIVYTDGPSVKSMWLAGKQRPSEQPISINLNGVINELSLSPNGEDVLTTVQLANNQTRNLNNLWLVSLRRNEKKPLRKDNAGYKNLLWSSDGTLFSYISNEGKTQGGGDVGSSVPSSLYIQNLKTGKRSQLLKDTWDAEWMPRSHFLVATSFGKPGLLLFRSSSSNPTTIQAIHKGGDISVAPNAARLGWVTAKRLRVFALPSDSKRLTISNNWRLVGTYDFPEHPEKFVFSPDGKMIALLLVNLMLPDEPRQLVVLEPENRRIRILGSVSGFPTGLRWSHNGRCVMMTHYLSLPETGPYQQEIAEVSVFDTASVPIKGANWEISDSAKLVTLLKLPPGGIKEVDWAEIR